MKWAQDRLFLLYLRAHLVGQNYISVPIKMTPKRLGKARYDPALRGSGRRTENSRLYRETLTSDRVWAGRGEVGECKLKL